MLKLLTLTGLSLLTTYAIATSYQYASINECQREQGVLTPSATPESWPDLDVLTHFENPKGNRCGLAGAAAAGSADAEDNRLRNRYQLPNSFEAVALESLLNLPHGEISPDGKSIIDLPTREGPDKLRGISITGFVTEVSILGCGVRSQREVTLSVRFPRRGVESANCYTSQPELCNTQIILKPDSNQKTTKGRNLFVVQVTERARRLAASGLLVSNIGGDWRIDALRKLEGHRVRISGWLFFNANYRERNWKADPEDSIGKSNRRETAWEIHPVMGIELDPSEPK